VGLKICRSLSLFLVSFSFAGLLDAAPMLRLVSATVGPVSTTAGTAGPTQIVEAYNAGTGSLNLTMSSSVSWIAPTVGASRACTTTTLAQTCIPLSFALNTAALSAGTNTGIVTVTDPNAVDSPQTITVTVNVGGGIPSSLSVYVPPGGALDTPAPTNSAVSWHAATNDGNQWLSLAITGAGSFKFNYPYTIHVAAQSGNTPGTYSGTLAISGSTFAGDNKTVPVTMNVTTGALARQPAPVTVTLAQGTPANGFFGPYIIISGFGQTGLSTATPTVATANSGTWLTAAALSPPSIPPGSVGAALAFDVTGLSPGTYTGTVKFATNAVAVCATGCTAGGAITVPVTLIVEAKGAPVITYQGVQDNATFVPGDTVSQGDVMVVKGDQLSLSAIALGPAPPLPTQLADTKVLVNNSAAPLFYTSYGQLAFQMPVTTPAGTAMVQVQRTDGSLSNSVSVNVAAAAPKLLLIYGGPYGAIVNQDGSLPLPSGYSTSAFAAHPAHAGDTLTMYAIGLGPTNPSVGTGQPAPSSPPYAPLVATAQVNFGNNPFAPEIIPLYAGLTPTYAGLYQVNVTIPSGVTPGTVYLVLELPTGMSNPVAIEVQ